MLISKKVFIDIIRPENTFHQLLERSLANPNVIYSGNVFVIPSLKEQGRLETSF